MRTIVKKKYKHILNMGVTSINLPLHVITYLPVITHFYEKWYSHIIMHRKKYIEYFHMVNYCYFPECFSMVNYCSSPECFPVVNYCYFSECFHVW